MKKQLNKKLTLNRWTVADLSREGMEESRGGATAKCPTTPLGGCNSDDICIITQGCPTTAACDTRSCG